MPSRPAGRPRDRAIDAAVLRAARELLSEGGVDALTVVAVAERAGTTRPAVYRRYPTLDALAVAAVASVHHEVTGVESEDPYVDLVRELTAFADEITSSRGIGLVATVLSPSTDPAAKDAYRERVVAPRRARLRAILDRGATEGGPLRGSVPEDRDLGVAMAVGSWYAHALAGAAPSTEWPGRTARMVWRALGGPDPAE